MLGLNVTPADVQDRDGFLQLARDEPERFMVIDGTLAMEEVTEGAIAATKERLSLLR